MSKPRPIAIPSRMEQQAGRIIPMFVCAGCRPEPLGYAILEVGDNLDQIVTCPMRAVCTWHAAHDLGGACQYNEQPEGSTLPPLFETKPFFSCPNFHEFHKLGAPMRATPFAGRPEAAQGVPTTPNESLTEPQTGPLTSA